ncbi:Excinuclease ABC C subunit domain protein [Gemmatirosa kalamazoonensis]|uniref:Excinuclease ABC C subunit domain protein n=1 Tax=Gemmatirosa kalamazoonensis TaxID=861299 RepID=W0RFE0_9BACT|nr:GIY-YIG nuclease family protein [Gemmatirosa kalamazoonensis]AHG89055.1 Excinuclease ABC C subunit domain protein [Gemmatirosa kalamazoonensis]
MSPSPRRSRPPQLRAPVASDDLRHVAYGPAPVAVRRQLRARVAAEAENRPGVYRMLGATGLVLYVGKSSRLRTRLLSYFQSARKRRRRDRQSRIVRMAHAIEWEYCHDEFAALLRELRLIKQHRPRFNIAMNVDEIRRGWLGLTSGPVPGLRLVLRSDDPEAAVLYGPFRRLSMLGDAMRALAEATGIRDCDLSTGGLAFADAPAKRRRGTARVVPVPTMTAAGGTLGEGGGAPLVPSPRSPGCLRYELGGCLGPCVGAPLAAAYAERVQEARDFLAGRTRRPIETLRGAMLAAAEAWHFERAGSLKTKLEALEWLAERLARFHAGADRLSFVHRARGHDGSERLYLVRRGTVRAERPAPTTSTEERELAALVQRVYEGPDPSGADIPTHDLEEFYLVASWFRKHPPQRVRVAGARAGS